MNCEELQIHLADVLSGTASAEAQGQAEAHLASCESCRAEFSEVQSAWDRLCLLPAGSPSQHLRTRFYDTLEAYQQGANQSPAFVGGSKLTRWVRAWLPQKAAAQLAAAAVLLAVGLGAGMAMSRVWMKPSETGQVSTLRKEVDHMRELVILSLLQQQSPSDRMQGVSWTAQAPTNATEVTGALIRTMQDDSSVNVRLAAVDALQKFTSNQSVRKSLVSSLATQDEPLVQIAMIDMLVQIREHSAEGVFRQLSKNPAVNEAVRKRADWALQQLAPRVE